ncbi:MCP four helix bundle domain-containing protein, partial [Skermanella aerolata]
MVFLNNIRIQTKILLALAVLGVLAIAMTGMSLIRMGEADARYSALLEGEAAAVKWLARANTTLVDVGRVLNLLIAEPDASRMRKLSTDIDKLVIQYGERAENVVKASPSAAERIRSLTRDFDALMPIRSEIEKASLVSDNDTALRLLAERFNPAFDELRSSLRSLVDELDTRMKAASDEATNAFLSTRLWILIIGVTGLAVCVGLALVIVRGGITAPINALVTVMRDLAGGNLGISVVGTERRDELGSMAQAVQVFKDSALERVRLEAAQTAERQAKEARAVEVERLIGGFEGGVGEILRTVASAATELDSTAQSMAAIAEETSRQATAAAAAAEQT